MYRGRAAQIAEDFKIYSSPVSALMVPASGDYPPAEFRYDNENRTFSFPEESFISDTRTLEAQTLPQGFYPVVMTNLSPKGYDIINDTKYTLDEEELLKMPYPYSFDGDGPLVLVLHTHGTEAFFEEDTPTLALYGNGGNELVDGYYNANVAAPRSDDTSKNIVRVGSVFSERLNTLGIETIHCQIMHDKDDYNTAYKKSLATAEEYLERYPSIKYIVDLHRDSLIRTNKEKLKPTVTVNGKKTAQIMIVAGSDAGGSYHPNWRENLAFFLKYKHLCDEIYPELSRVVYLRTSRFNQHLTKASFILEVGSCGNTLEEAENAALLAADVLAELIYRNK